MSAALGLLTWAGLAIVSLSAQFSYTEDFVGTTAQGWNLVQGQSGENNGAYLTAAQATDPIGTGWLRLTDSGHNQANAAWFDCPLPASSGSTIQVTFTMAMYNAEGIGGGDGIGFFLWDAQSTFNAGAFGGSLAYAPKTGIPGLSEGYVGVGFDVYGNYSNPTEGRTGGPGFTPEAVAIRGGPASYDSSGNPYTNYDYLSGATTPYDLDFASLTTRPDQSTQYRNVRVTIGPIYDSNGTVIASSVIVEMQFGENGLWQTITTATLYGTRPDELRMGFGASTGDAQQTYEINRLGVSVSASADSNIWDNASGNSIWDNANPTNWNVNTTPSDRANVIFNDSHVTNNQNISLIGARTISGAWFGGTYSYALNAAATGLLIFDTGTSTQSSTIALLNSETGNNSHQINVPIEIHNDLTIYNYAGQTLTIGGAIANTTTSLSLGAFNLYNQGSATTVITSTISGAGAIFENGVGGRLILAGANTHTGLTTVSAGALIAANPNALGSSASATIVHSGATLGLSNSGTIHNESLSVYTGAGDSNQGQIHNIAGTNTYASTVALTNSSTAAAAVTIAADAGSTLNVTGVISGNTLSGINKIGDGTLILSGLNTYTGATTISGGILQINADSGLGATPSTAAPGSLTFNGGTLALSANTVLNSNRSILLDTMSGTIEVSSATTTTYAGSVAGSGNLTKTGDGTLLLNSANTYTGSTNINNGTLIINSGSSISDTGVVTIANTATAALVLSSSETIGSLAGGGGNGGAVHLNNNTLTIGANNSSTTFGGALSGSGGIVKNGTGTLTLTGNETYTGATTINSGTLALGANNVLSSTTSIILNGGTLATGGYTDSVGTLVLSRSSTLALGANPGQFTFSSASTPSRTSSILLITDWTGSLGGGSGTQLFLASTDTASLSILSQIQFDGYNVGASRLFTGEVVPAIISNGYYWNSSQTNWATNYAWNNATGSAVLTGPNATGALAVFGKLDANSTNSTNTPKTATLTSNQTVGYISFNSTQAAENYTITGSGTLIFSVSGTNSAYINMTSTASNLIAAPIALSSSLVISQNGATTSSLTLAGALTTNNKNITVDGVGNTLISGNIGSSTTTLTKTGSGTLTLSGTNSYSGGTAINGGTVAVNTTRNLGIVGNTLTFSNGTLAANGSFTLSGNITLNPGGGTVNVTNSATVTASGNVIGTGDITKTGAGTLILSGANTYSGTTYINQGTLVASSTNAIGDTSAVVIANVSGATLALSSSETIGSLTGGGTNAGTVALNGYTLTTGGTNASTTYDGLITGTSTLSNIVKTGTGTLVLTNNSNSYTGTTTLSGGELIMVNSGALGTGTVSVTSGATLTLSGSSPISAPSAKTLYLNGIGIGSQGALNNEAGNNTWAGAVALSSASTIGLNGATLTVSGNVALGANALTVNGSYDGVLSGILSSTSTLGTLIKSGTGTLTLSGANTYTGTTTVSNGTLAITSNTALGNTVRGTTVTNGATLALSNNITVGTETLTILGSGYNNNGVIQSSGNNTLTGAVAMSLEPQINVSSGTLTMTGILSGTSGLSKNGAGTLILSGANTFNGAVSINEGILAVQSNAALATTSTSVRTTIHDGATLQIGTTSSLLTIGESITANATGSGGIGALYNSGGNNTISGLLTLASDSTVNIANATTLSATNVINGSGTLTKTGSGTLVLSGANTYTGDTHINQGTIVVTADTSLGAVPASARSNSLTLNNATLATSNSFTLDSNRGIVLSGTADTIAVNGANTLTAGGVISGSAGLTKAGSGTLVLSGANTYTGTTTVTGGGTLALGNNNVIANNSSILLNNSALATNGYSDQVGTLTYSGLNATLDLGGQAANSALTFSNILATGTSSSSILSITNWTGNIDGGSGSQVYSTTSITNSTLLATQIQFDGFALGARQLTGGELVPLLTGTYWNNSNSSGIWNTNSNWNPNSNPRTRDALAVFGSTSSSGSINTNIAKTVTINAGSTRTVGYLLFDSSNADEAFTIAGTNANSRLILNVSSGNALINVSATTASNTISVALSLSDSTNIRNNGGGTLYLTNTITTGGNDIIVDGTGYTLISATFGAATTLTKSNTGTLTLSGTNTYTGGTTINGGVLAISTDTNLGSTTNRAITFDGGELAVNTTSGLTLTGNITLNNGGGAINVTNATSTLSTAGNITGSGGLTKTGSGTLILSGANTYTGDTHVNQGTLMLGASNTLANTNITLGANTTLALNGHTDTVGTLTLTGNSTLDLGNGVASTIHFANSAAIDWGSNILTIINYDADANANNDYVYFDPSAATLSSHNIGQIRFLDPVGYSPALYYATILADGRIVPIVPEPTTLAGAALLLGWTGWKLRRRCKALRQSMLDYSNAN